MHEIKLTAHQQNNEIKSPISTQSARTSWKLNIPCPTANSNKRTPKSIIDLVFCTIRVYLWAYVDNIVPEEPLEMIAMRLCRPA